MLILGSTALSACGGKRSDADERAGQYPVEVVTSEFATRQQLARTEELRLGVRNSGNKRIPNLAVTLQVQQHGNGIARGSFSTLDPQQDLADRSRPVWILEQGWPKVDGSTSPSGASTAKTNTFAFGPLDAGDTLDAVWRLTPVRPGTWTLSYSIAAGTEGKARAVDETGERPRGTFQPTIAREPRQTSVDDAGKVVPKK